MTFTLDEHTAARLRLAARRLAKAQSEVVREAVNQFADRVGQLDDDERRRMLAALRTLAEHPVSRGAGAVRREVRAIREARRSGGRRSLGTGT